MKIVTQSKREFPSECRICQRKLRRVKIIDRAHKIVISQRFEERRFEEIKVYERHNFPEEENINNLVMLSPW